MATRKDTPALSVRADGSIRRGGTLAGAWFTTPHDDESSGLAVAVVMHDGDPNVASRGLGGAVGPGPGGVEAVVRGLVADVFGYLARPTGDSHRRVGPVQAIVMLAAIGRGERPWAGRLRDGAGEHAMDPGDPDAGAPACLDLLDALGPGALGAAAAKVVAMEGLDPVVAFEAWKATQPWGEAVFVGLRRGVLEPDDIHVASIEVPTRLAGRGHGRQAFVRLVELADAAGVPLTLEVSAASVSARWLHDWYGRLGFEPHPAGQGDWGPLMVRPAPAPSPCP